MHAHWHYWAGVKKWRTDGSAALLRKGRRYLIQRGMHLPLTTASSPHRNSVLYLNTPETVIQLETHLVRLADERSSNVLYFPKMESLALGYLAGSLRANSFKAKIVDEEATGSSREQILKQVQKADLIGFSAIAKPQIFPIIETVKTLRENGCNAHISIGGQYATFLYRELLGLKGVFDSVVRFEGEQTFVELAQAIEESKNLAGVKGLAFRENGKMKENPLRPLVENLDSIPFPARDALPMVLQHGGLPAISSSRGCYNKCSYCSISAFYSAPSGKPFRFRSAKNVLSELKELKLNFPSIGEIWFVDDNFVIPGETGLKRTIELCNGIKKLGLEFDIYLRANDVNEKLVRLLKQSGLRNIFIGAEAGNDFTLQKIFNKNISAKQTMDAIKLCNRMQISVDPGFIMFHPWSTMQEIGQNIKFLEETKQYTLYGIASYLTPYSFTPIGKKMLKGKIPFKKPRFPPNKKLNDFVPYEIIDARAELLLCLTLNAFEEFRELPLLFSKLKQKARKLRSRGKQKEAGEAEKEWVLGTKRMNQAGMRFFKELFCFMEKTELSDSKIKPFFAELKSRIKAYVKGAAEGLNRQGNGISEASLLR